MSPSLQTKSCLTKHETLNNGPNKNFETGAMARWKKSMSSKLKSPFAESPLLGPLNMLGLFSPIDVASRPSPNVGLDSFADDDTSDTDVDEIMPQLPSARPVPPRRVQSMYENPQARRDSSDGHPAITSLSEHIPTFTRHNESLPRISAQTLLEALNGDYKQHIDEIVIVDCRFAYEYEGGHVEGAINLEDRDALELYLAQLQDKPARRLFVMHCEFSVLRGPAMARYLREYDRRLNAERYPRLSFPDVVVLDGGYSAFFLRCKARCSPQGYVEMNNPVYEERRRLQMRRVRADERIRSCINLGAGRATKRLRLLPSSTSKPESSGRPLLRLDVRATSCLLLNFEAGIPPTTDSLGSPVLDFIPPCPSFMYKNPFSSPGGNSSSTSSLCSEYSPTDSISLLNNTDSSPFFDDKLMCERSMSAPPLLHLKLSPLKAPLHVKERPESRSKGLGGPFIPLDSDFDRKRSPFN